MHRPGPLANTKRLLDSGVQVLVRDIKGDEVVRELCGSAHFVLVDVTKVSTVSSVLDTAETLDPLRIVSIALAPVTLSGC